MFRSTGLRFLAVGFLVLLMSIPLGLVSEVVQERSRYSDQTIRDISREWGGPQLISGPVLVIPVTAEVEEEVKTLVHDPETGIAQRDSDGDRRAPSAMDIRSEWRIPGRRPLPGRST